MLGLVNFEINTKRDLIFISKDSQINNLYINCDCKIDGLFCSNIYVNAEVMIVNCIVDGSVVINNPKKSILIRNCMISDIQCSNIGNFDTSIHIEHNLIYENVVIKDFNKLNKNVCIYIYQNEIGEKVSIYNDGLELKDAAICVSSNRFKTYDENNIYADIPMLVDVKDNYYLKDYRIKFIKFKKFNNFTGYHRNKLLNGISLFVLESEFRKKQIVPNRTLKLKSIPQYISNENDPALKTGCEATSCAITLNYIFNTDMTKNDIVPYMEIKEPGTDSFWNAFIGDIYNDGWGCMSPVVVNTLNKYLTEHGLDKDYYVFNTTNMPLHELFEFVNSGIPVIVWCTMGNKDYMYHKKHGSTIWDVNGETLYWPGNDHCVVLAGYSYTTRRVFLADPESNDNRLVARNMYEFENRFMELYSQSVVILKKRPTR